jgi:hypothetical protein
MLREIRARPRPLGLGFRVARSRPPPVRERHVAAAVGALATRSSFAEYLVPFAATAQRVLFAAQPVGERGGGQAVFELNGQDALLCRRALAFARARPESCCTRERLRMEKA